MTAIRHRARRLALTLVLLFGAHAATGCSPSSQQKAVTDTLTAVNAASAAFVAFDSSHQQALVAQSTTAEGAKTALAIWRTTQTKVLTLLTAAYQTIAAAATSVTSQNVNTMLAAAAALASELAADGIRP